MARHGVAPTRALTLFRVLIGQSLGYKNICSKILNDLQPFMTGAAPGVGSTKAKKKPSQAAPKVQTGLELYHFEAYLW